ncbi:6041_t:CDS:2, partial [Cetraspora pellucida]
RYYILRLIHSHPTKSPPVAATSSVTPTTTYQKIDETSSDDIEEDRGMNDFTILQYAGDFYFAMQGKPYKGPLGDCKKRNTSIVVKMQEILFSMQ